MPPKARQGRRPQEGSIICLPAECHTATGRRFAGRGAATLAAAFILVLTSVPALADAFAARVTAVIDGATITVTAADNRRQRQVRLLGVDAPARASALGNASRTALSGLLFARDVRVEAVRQDGQRLVGKVVVLADAACQGPRCPGVDAGRQQIGTGMAAWNRRDAAAQTPEDQDAYQQAEFAAQLRRLGVWAESRRRERR